MNGLKIGWRHGPELTRKNSWAIAIRYNWDWTPWYIQNPGNSIWFGIQKGEKEHTTAFMVALGFICYIFIKVK